METLDLIIDFHKSNPRQGPGSQQTTIKALQFLPQLTPQTQLLDVGCGTGAQTMVLSEQTPAHITAVDSSKEFLSILKHKVLQKGITNRLTVKGMDMEQLAFAPESLDVIWAEGAIYNIGFSRGIREWRPLLKKDGYLVVSEISWLTPERPQIVDKYWTEVYPEMGTIAEKTAQIEEAGYIPVAHFVLPESDWTSHYYHYYEANEAAFLERHSHSEDAKALVEENRQEMKHFEKYSAYYNYVFYIMQKR